MSWVHVGVAEQWSRFTRAAQMALQLTQQEADQSFDDHVGPEHLLIALMREGQGVAAQLIHDVDLRLSLVRDFVESPGQRRYPFHPRPATRGLMAVIHTALIRPRAGELERVDTGDLLLGLMTRRDNVSDVLRSAGLTRRRFRRQVGQLKPEG